MNELAESIHSNDISRYQHVRYPAIQDGEPVVFNNEDFTGTNFGAFSAGFFEFNNCTLDRASELYGQPITIRGGTARNIDLRAARAIIKATGCDFTGMRYDDSTELAYGEDGSDAKSEFVDCTIDPLTKQHFQKQGVLFH